MKIFKNRGDFYISKSNYKRGKEERILVIILVLIVIFTTVFIVFLSQKYDSAADFFAEGEVTLNSDEDIVTEEQLPKISGKSNFLFLETDDENSLIHYIFFVQADSDSFAYKVSALSPDMMIEKQSLTDIYSQGGGASLQSKLTEYFGFEIDYYIQFKKSSFVEFANELGTFIYPSSQNVKFNGGSGDDTYSIRIKEGEQNINGKNLSNLLRYFTTEKKQYNISNEILLYALTELVNADNYDDKEGLFRLLISSSSTNITVRNFTDAADSLTVFCKENESVTVYSAVAQYDNSMTITQSSMSEIKGYFSK